MLELIGLLIEVVGAVIAIAMVLVLWAFMFIVTAMEIREVINYKRNRRYTHFVNQVEEYANDHQHS